MHQVGLAETHAAIEEQRVERHALGFGRDAPRAAAYRELVGLADDEVFEGEARVERRADLVPSVRRFPFLPRVGSAAARPGAAEGIAATYPAAMPKGRQVNDDVDPPDCRVLAAPERAQAVGVVRHHPIAHETASAPPWSPARTFSPRTIIGFSQLR